MTSRVLGALRIAARPRARADRRADVWRSSGSPTSRCSSGTRRTSAGAPSTTRSRGRPTSGTSVFDQRSRRTRRAIAYDLIGNGNELGGGSFRIHEPDAAGARLRPARDHAPRSSGRSSASCSTRSGWARRRTAGSRSGSTGCSMVLLDEPNLRDTIAFPKNQAGVDPMTGAPTDADRRAAARSSGSGSSSRS